MTYNEENIIARLQKLYSLPRNPRVGSKSPMLFVKKLFARAIYCLEAKYSLKGLIRMYATYINCQTLNHVCCFINPKLNYAHRKIHFHMVVLYPLELRLL